MRFIMTGNFALWHARPGAGRAGEESGPRIFKGKALDRLNRKRNALETYSTAGNPVAFLRPRTTPNAGATRLDSPGRRRYCGAPWT